MPTEEQITVIGSLSEVEPQAWDALAGRQPFVQHAFLYGLEKTGCIGGETGWHSVHLLLHRGGQLVGAMPLYLRDDSYGEFVFDFAWADAYQRHGMQYYPKLLTAIPFTPVTGRRLLAHQRQDQVRLIQGALQLAQDMRASSWHCLFPTQDEAGLLAELGLMQRFGIQFHWRNAGYADFAEYLAQMSHDKRKKVKQERRRVVEAGVHFQHLVGEQISREDWAFFFQCYQGTYAMHHSPPYMNLEFFMHVGAKIAQNVMLIMAYQGRQRCAVALNFFDEERLYGRYWGTQHFVSGLHFETCYYQSIEFAIQRGLKVFEGGAQGEHKLARGMLPVTTTSAHWLADPRFSRAIADFLRREQLGVAQYVQELQESSPFRGPPLEL